MRKGKLEVMFTVTNIYKNPSLQRWLDRTFGIRSNVFITLGLWRTRLTENFSLHYSKPSCLSLIEAWKQNKKSNSTEVIVIVIVLDQIKLRNMSVYLHKMWSVPLRFQCNWFSFIISHLSVKCCAHDLHRSNTIGNGIALKPKKKSRKKVSAVASTHGCDWLVRKKILK